MKGDGEVEDLSVTNQQALIIASNTALWQSPKAWQVLHGEITDLDQDGLSEVTLLVRRPFQPWPIDRFLPYPGRIRDFHDAAGFSCHVIMIGWRRGAFREVWAGSAMSQPLQSFAAGDLTGDGKQELIALEGNYTDLPVGPARSLTAWEWNGFGFTLIARSQGPFRNLRLFGQAGGGEIVVVER